MVHRGGLETNLDQNKKNDFNICLAEDAKTADDEIYHDQIEDLVPKAKQTKRVVIKASAKSTSLPLSDHSISQSVVRLERSRFIKKKNTPNSKADTSGKSACISPVRAGLRSNSLESHTSTTSNNNNAKGRKKKINRNKKGNSKSIDSPPQETVNAINNGSNVAQPKISQQLPLTFICSLPLERLSGILDNLKIDKTKCLLTTEEDTTAEEKLNVDQSPSQCKTLCLYCDKRMSTAKVRSRHIERFHTISKERRSSTRNPIISSQDSYNSAGSLPASSLSLSPSTPKLSSNVLFSGCSFCSKSPKLQAVALENDLNALFYHLVDLHSDKYFGCKLCAIRFQNAIKLGDHVQRTHAQLSKIAQATADADSLSVVPDEERNTSELGKSTPTKTRRQLKQINVEGGRATSDLFPLSTTAGSSTPSSVSRNGSMFSNDEPFLSRLGVTQNRLPRGRKGIRSRRQTNVDCIKSDNSLTNVKTRSKFGKVCSSNDPIEAVFRTPTNTRTEPLSCTFDEDFYEKVFSNVRNNLSCHLDGKLDKDLLSNRPQSPPLLMPAIRSTVVKSPNIDESEVHTATSLAAITAFPTLLTAEQYGCDFGTAKIKRPITKHSWKWKWDSVKKYKYVNEGGKIVKKIKQPMLGLRDLSKLDMWTQLTMRQKHEVVRKQAESESSKSLVKVGESSREEKQKQVDQLNTILDSRRLPQIILEQNEQTIIKLEITDEGFRYLAGEMLAGSECNESSRSQSIDRIAPANLNLIPCRSLSDPLRHTVVLSGEWARPRCYVCFGCGARFDKLKALEEHKMFRHPHVYSTHYEIVGRELIEGNLYKHFFIPLKALSRNREYTKGMLLNKKTESSVSKSSSNSGNEEESLDSLHSVTVSFTTHSSSKLSDDCDTDTKTAIENVSSSLSYTEPSTLSSKTYGSSTVVSSFFMACTKCNRSCHGMLELYRHMLDCSGDYAWLLAKKKKYRYYGSRKRRQFNKHSISTLHLHKRKVKENREENESDATPKKKPANISPSTPRPRPSDADSIRKMLENLPPKRVCREIIPNATKPRSRKFKTTAVRKMQQNSVNKKCKSSNTTINSISKKLLRNQKLRAISEKDKIARSNKIFENKRKSARVNSGVSIVNKNIQSTENKTNKRTESGKCGKSGSIVRKIGLTTKRFVKKIKKRLLGEKQSGSASTTTGEDEKNSVEKKLSAVRKLTFDKDKVASNMRSIESEEKPIIESKESAMEAETHKNKNDKSLQSSYLKSMPTVAIETDAEWKKSQNSLINENTPVRSKSSMENVYQPQHDLSASTEDLHKVHSSLLQNQVSPTTKRRSKKLNDCIAMLTGKLQEKMGLPFLECNETAGGANTNQRNNAEITIVPSSNEINRETKHAKRKAFTRKIVKCDPPAETNVTLSLVPRSNEPVTIVPPVREAEAALKPLSIKQPPLKDKKTPANEAPANKTSANEPRVKDPTINEHSSKESSVESSLVAPPIRMPFETEPQLKDLPFTSSSRFAPSLLKHSLREIPSMECLHKIDLRNPALAAINQFIPVPPGKKTCPNAISIEVTTSTSASFKEIPKKSPAERKQPPKQQCIVNADTIRVPCIKPPQLTIPQFTPGQIPAQRGMIAKRRQTIAGAPNDFLSEMNSLRCANTYNNLPFELEVPLDLSKKPKRSSPKSKAFPPHHHPQISVKSNAVLMPPMPFPLPNLPQTQIIPIMCESLQPKLPQVSLKTPPPLLLPKETLKPTASAPRKRANNNKKETDVSHIAANPPFINLTINASLPIRVNKKIPVTTEVEKLRANPIPVSLASVIREPILSLPVTQTTEVLKLNKEPKTDVNELLIEDQLNEKENVEQIKQALSDPEAINTIPPIQISMSEEKAMVPVPLMVKLPLEGEKCLPPEVKAASKSTETKESLKINKKSSQVTPVVNKENKQSEVVNKTDNKCELSPESQKSLPTRRSRRNKAADQADHSVQKNASNDVRPSAFKEVEEIAASFLSEEEQENEYVDREKSKSLQEEVKPSEAPDLVNVKSNENEKTNDEVNDKKQIVVSTEKPKVSKKLSSDKQNLLLPVTDTKAPNNQPDSSKKPRRRRKNELAAIVADQLMESFKEVDKSRLDDLKKLENLAYEKSEDLLLTGMRLMPTTKRKNVLDNKKEIGAEQESRVTIAKEAKKQKVETVKEKKVQRDDALFREPKQVPTIDAVKVNVQKQDLDNVVEVASCKEDVLPLPIDFGNYRTNAVGSWAQNRGPVQNNVVLLFPENEKSPNYDVAFGATHKKCKKKQMKKRDKKIEIENINQLRNGLESFTLSKDVVALERDDVRTQNRAADSSLLTMGLFKPTPQRCLTNLTTSGKEPEVSAFASLADVKSTSSILRPSILAASLDMATNKETPTQSDRKSSISSRDPRLNKNIHIEESDVSVPPETASRLSTLRQRRKSFVDVSTPTTTSRSKSASNKRSEVSSRRNSIAFDDDEDDNYLTAIAKRVNDKIMSAEDKDFNLANDGFDLANTFLDIDDPFGRPSTSMSVRSAPNLNEDRSNMDTMDATNTDLIDMDVDDDMSVYTTFSQDTSRSVKGRRRRRRRSVLLTRKPKKTNINTMEPSETFDCLLCKKTFAKSAALNKHQLTIAHVTKVSEQEYLNATRKQQEEFEQASFVSQPAKIATTRKAASFIDAESPKQTLTEVECISLEESVIHSKAQEFYEKPVEKVVDKPPHLKVPYIPPSSILNQSGIEPISSPEQSYERYSAKTSSRLTLNPDERLFYECCNILKGSETPLVERTYPIVPPTTYAYDLQVKPVTPKSTSESFSFSKQSTAEAAGRREIGGYPRLDVNQFSDISSDSNPACAQPPPILPINYPQMHVLSGAKDLAVLPNDEGDGGALRSNLPRENQIPQMSSLISPNPVVPLTARTFVNQPSQIGVHLHGLESAATVTQKQNFISPLHSASSQSDTITTTTCRLKTKAAMKGYDNLKVSIPTIGLDMEHALERSPRAGCKLTTLAEIALGNETPMTALTSFTPAMQIHSDQNSSKYKQTKHNNIIEHVEPPTILNQTKSSQTLPKKEKSRVKESSPAISVHDTESCMPIVLSLPKKPESIIAKDIYEFDDSEITPISKAIQSPFKIAEENDRSPKKAIIIPERPFKNIGMEEQEGIKFQKPETPAINDENTTSTVTYSDRDDFVYGSISGGDDDNDNDIDNDDNKDGNANSAESSNSSAFTAKTFENKSLIMGRIFKHAKTKPKIPIEKSKLPTPEPPKQIPKQELDRLFDTLRGLNENRQGNATPQNAPNSTRNRESQTTKRKVSAAATKTKTNTNTPSKKAANKEGHCSKEMAQLHAELGMSPAEIAELIGEGQRKSQRRCAVNRPKKLVEIWSSDEFEEFVSTKDIIAFIAEKEEETKRRKKPTTTAAKKSNQPPPPSNINKKNIVEQQKLQSEDEKASTSPQKIIKNNPKVAKENGTKTKTIKGKKKGPTSTANIMPPTKPSTKKIKETKSATTNRRNSFETSKIKASPSPFKKPKILSKTADDSESDFEAELNRKSKGVPIRNRRKTISGKLENDAGSSSSTKQETVKSNKSKIVSESTTTRKSAAATKSPSVDSQTRPQARRKRIASEMLYYWSSSSDEEFGRIESAHDDDDHIDESENYQQHGWIVGDSHKKLVTLLAIAKGNKKVDDCGVKETVSKKKS